MRSRMVRIRIGTLLGLVAMAVGAAPLLAQDKEADEKWKKAVIDFKDDFKKQSIAFKITAIEGLPLNDGRTIEFIIEKEKLLSHKDWQIREIAADRLGKIQHSDLRKKMLTYAKDSDKRIREGIMAALATNTNPQLDPPVILEGLSDSAWEVRRMACWAAGEQRIKEAVPRMIDMLHQVGRDGKVIQEGESNPRVHSVLLYNLEAITGQVEFHTDVQQWKPYWEKNKDRSLPPVKRFDQGNFGDVKLDFNDTYARKGTGPLILVLPGTHKICTYYMPYFNQWLFVKWLYINLPPIRSFPNVQYDDQNEAIYPVDILVDAFEEGRKKYNVEKMAILAHDFSCWVGAKYAQKYPDRVSGLIFLNPFATNETFGKHIDEALRSGNLDDEFWGKVCRRQIKPASTKEWQKHDYVRDSTLIKDMSDLELMMLRRIWVEPGAETIVIPQFDIRGEETSRTPVMMFFAPKDKNMSGADDIGRLKRYYPHNIIVQLKKSAQLPFMEEPDTFEKALRAFVDSKLN